MTLEELRQKSEGVLEKRSIIVSHKKFEDKSYYFLGKLKDGSYFIGFSSSGNYCSRSVCEKNMLHLINNKEFSDAEAYDIYFHSPHLSCWMHD